MQNQTKKIISETLTTMVKEKGFDDITITDLVDQCGISRQTFYYHFSDLMDVLEWNINKIVEQVVSACNESGDLKASIRIVLLAGLENQGILRILLESRLRGKIEMRLLDAIKRGLESGVKAMPPRVPKSEEELQGIMDFFAYGIIGLLLFRDINQFENLEQSTEAIYNLITNALTNPEGI